MAPRPKALPKKRSQKNADKKQSERFIEAARTLGADEDARKFEEAFAKIIPAKRRPKSSF